MPFRVAPRLARAAHDATVLRTRRGTSSSRAAERVPRRVVVVQLEALVLGGQEYVADARARCRRGADDHEARRRGHASSSLSLPRARCTGPASAASPTPCSSCRSARASTRPPSPAGRGARARRTSTTTGSTSPPGRATRSRSRCRTRSSAAPTAPASARAAARTSTSSRTSTRRTTRDPRWAALDGSCRDDADRRACAILRRLMAVPKRKTSKSRRDKRRATHAIEAPRVNVCPQCGQPKLPHRSARPAARTRAARSSRSASTRRSPMTRIAVDAMGGDRAPDGDRRGRARRARRRGLTPVLFGPAGLDDARARAASRRPT